MHVQTINLAECPTVKNDYFNLFYKGFLQWVWGSQALEEVLLFSVPLHPMLICGNKYVSRITETLGIKNIFQQYIQHVYCACMYNIRICQKHWCLHH